MATDAPHKSSTPLSSPPSLSPNVAIPGRREAGGLYRVVNGNDYPAKWGMETEQEAEAVAESLAKEHKGEPYFVQSFVMSGWQDCSEWCDDSDLYPAS